MSCWVEPARSSELNKRTVCVCTRVLACLQGFVLGCEHVVVRTPYFFRSARAPDEAPEQAADFLRGGQCCWCWKASRLNLPPSSRSSTTSLQRLRAPQAFAFRCRHRCRACDTIGNATRRPPARRGTPVWSRRPPRHFAKVAGHLPKPRCRGRQSTCEVSMISFMFH